LTVCNYPADMDGTNLISLIGQIP